MFIGHAAAGFASKRMAPRTSLGLLMAAPLLLDLIWPVFLLAGIEHVRVDMNATKFTKLDFDHYPWSHSLVMAAVWSIVAGGAYWLWTRYARGAAVIAAGVLSHWVFDFITHRPDLPLYPGSPKVGLGLWNSIGGTLVVEVGLFMLGMEIYLRTAKPRDRTGILAFWGLVAFFLLIYAANVGATPPKDVRLIAFAGLLSPLFPLWAWWIDRHRAVTT